MEITKCISILVIKIYYFYTIPYMNLKIIDSFNLENNIIIFLTKISFVFQYSQYILSDKEQLRAKRFIRESDCIRFKVLIHLND